MNRTGNLFCILALSASCATATKEPDPELTLAPGKTDVTDSVQLRGELALGGEVQGEFTEELQIFAYTFTVQPGAVVTIDNSNLGTSRNLDTLLYVFGPRTENGYGTRSLSRDDDSGWGPHARIENLELSDGGEYLVALATYQGTGLGRYRLTLACESDACAPEITEGACSFGETFRDLKQSEHVFIIRRREIRTTEELSLAEQQQLTTAVSEQGMSIETAAQALEHVDEGRVNHLEIWDTSNERAFEIYEFGLGDNSYGSYFEAGATTVVAAIRDGDLYGCTVPRGLQARDCSSDTDCGEGLRCEGTFEGRGKCFATEFHHPAEAQDCARMESTDRRDITDSCPSGSGLICAGVGPGGDGLCFPVWQRSRQPYAQSFDQSIAVAAGESLEVSFTFYGMTTVSMDARASGSLLAEGPVRVLLTNPLGTEGAVFEGSVDGSTFFNAPTTSIPGDEDANGRWLLTVENSGTSEAQLRDLAVEIQSRYD